MSDEILLIDPNLVSCVSADELRVQTCADDDYGLMNSIQTIGQITPILVRNDPEIENKYILVSGGRRLSVCSELGINVRAMILDIDEVQACLIALHEHFVRKPISFADRAIAAAKLRDRHGSSNSVIASALDCSQAAVGLLTRVGRWLPSPIVDWVGDPLGLSRNEWTFLAEVMEDPATHTVILDRIRMDSDPKAKSGTARIKKIKTYLSQNSNTQT